MNCELPAGTTWRRPTLADAYEIWRFVSAQNTAIIGFADCTLDDVRDELGEPDFDPERDGWLVHDRDGTLAGYGWACRKGDSDEIDVDAISADETVGAWLWTAAIERAGEVAAELGHSEITLDAGIYRVDEAQQGRAESFGFVPATTFHRMRVDQDGTHTEPHQAQGVVVRTGEHDVQVRRDAHDIWNAANVGQFGHVPRSFSEWHDVIEASSTRDWSQLRVADLDGRPAAMLLGNDQFVADESCGYVARVAVLEAARGRGLAKLLLRQAFAADANKGRAGTILHVDTNNPTPALGLYESVGMRPVLVIDMWRRSLSAGNAPEPDTSMSPRSADR